MTFYTDAVSADLDRYETQQQKALARLPKCDICGKRIQDTYYYEINDEKVCPGCLDSEFKKDIDFD